MTPLALFLALVLGAAAAHKLAARDRLAAATGRLLGVRAPLAFPAMIAAAAIECAAAVSLLFPASRAPGAVLGALLWTAYWIALAAARRRGEGAIDCGCDLAARLKRIDRFMLWRPAGLAMLAIGTALAPAAPSAIAAEPVLAALALYALFLAAGELAALPTSRRSLAQ